MKHQSRISNMIKIKARKRSWQHRRVGLVLGVFAVVGLAFVAYERPPAITAISSNAPTVTVFTPSSPPYSSRKTKVVQHGPDGYRVIDGDTIEAPFGVKYRLLGYDTPETYFSKCYEELALGRKDAERLNELLASEEVRIVETGETGKYGRSLAYLHVNGRDVGQIPINEGLARSYDGGRRQGWCG